jgi:tRNA-binding EMAP/Myf-like protein
VFIRRIISATINYYTLTMADISEYLVGVVVSVEELPAKTKGGKVLKICYIRVGEDGVDPLLTVVTGAPNVREGSRVAVAPVGSTVETEEGGELKIQKTAVGGTMSEGMLCDSRMLGWSGGAAGIAVQIPDSVAIGSAPPATKPRPNDGKEGGEEVPSGPVTEGLFEKKLTKEEKKKLAAEKRAAKKAAKES